MGRSQISKHYRQAILQFWKFPTQVLSGRKWARWRFLEESGVGGDLSPVNPEAGIERVSLTSLLSTIFNHPTPRIAFCPVVTFSPHPTAVGWMHEGPPTRSRGFQYSLHSSLAAASNGSFVMFSYCCLFHYIFIIVPYFFHFSLLFPIVQYCSLLFPIAPCCSLVYRIIVLVYQYNSIL